jgi:hypothetical protein
MPITVDTILAGMQQPLPFVKVGGTMSAVGGMRAYTPRYVGGVPGAATAPSSGVNGAAVVNGSGNFPRTNAISPLQSYLGRFAIQGSSTGTMWIVDRLWENSGLDPVSIVAQNITPAALPARDGAGTTNGDQVLAGIEWSATGGAGTPTVTLTYTNQAGVAGRSATMTGVTTPNAGTVEIFSLASGDTGIRSVQSFIQSATRTSGTQHLVLFRVLGQVECTSSNVGNAIDALTGGRPRIFDNTTIQMLWFPSGTTGVNMIGTYIETHVNPA